MQISTLLLTVCTAVKSKVEISQNFVAFSKYMNFTVDYHIMKGHANVLEYWNHFWLESTSIKKWVLLALWASLKRWIGSYCGSLWFGIGLFIEIQSSMLWGNSWFKYVRTSQVTHSHILVGVVLIQIEKSHFLLSIYHLK